MTATAIPTTPRFQRGDLVTHTDGQGVKTTARIASVHLVKGATETIRYYRLQGWGVLVADGLEAAA